MKARYQILAMVTDKKALGLSLNNGRPISVEGNPHMYYEGPEDMERFAQYIKNEYSINDFDDDDFALIIVDCGADCAAAKSLHAKTLTAKCSSLIEAEYVLPFIAAKKRAIKKGEEFAVTIADAAYTLRADDKGRIDCVRCTADAPPPENALSLELADFTALFFADASVFGRDEDALKQKDVEIAKLKADAERQIAEIKQKDAEIAELKADAERRLAEIDKQKNELNRVARGLWEAVETIPVLESYRPSYGGRSGGIMAAMTAIPGRRPRYKLSHQISNINMGSYENMGTELIGCAFISSYAACYFALLATGLTNEYYRIPDKMNDIIIRIFKLDDFGKRGIANKAIDDFVELDIADKAIDEFAERMKKIVKALPEIIGMNYKHTTDERVALSNCLVDFDALRKANALPADERNAAALANAALAAAKHADAAIAMVRAPMKKQLNSRYASVSDKRLITFFNAMTRVSQNAVALAKCVLPEEE